jgi:hypothetical protein
VEGSRLPEVEDAFRILYEDYPPIRLAGNLLFDMIGRAEEVPDARVKRRECRADGAGNTCFFIFFKKKLECRADEAGSSYLN